MTPALWCHAGRSSRSASWRLRLFPKGQTMRLTERSPVPISGRAYIRRYPLKRSVAVSLVIMGAAALAACEDQTVDTAIYGSVDECIADRVYTPEKCETDFKAALAAHEKVAPAFATREDCEAEFGPDRCRQATEQHASGGFPFLPLLAGYMIGRTLGGGPVVDPQPLYRCAGSDAYVNARGTEVARSTGPVKVSTRSGVAKTPPATTRTIARGGFGSRSIGISA